MIGAIAGDMIGSVYEGRPIKTPDFEPLFHDRCRFTDDTVLSCAVAEHLLDGAPLVDLFRAYFRRYPHAGYGGAFFRWAESASREPYYSFGNGSAMRVSPVGFASDALDDAIEHAGRTAAVTHDHPEGIKGAQAVAAAIVLARAGRGKDAIRDVLAARFGYDLDEPLESIRPRYAFDVTCQGSVPQAIRAFLESADFEGAVRNAVSLGGDSDTQACIAGGIAQAYYGGVPGPIAERVFELLDGPLTAVVRRFGAAYGCL